MPLHNYIPVHYQIGGSYGVVVDNIPLAFGGDLNIIPSGEKIYFGFTRSGGFGTLGKEIHIDKIETVSCIQSQINIFDLFGRVYDSIMEW